MNKHLLGIGLACWLGVAFALLSQHVWDMQPCPWCIIQRMIYVVLGLAALAAAFWPRKRASFGASLTAQPARVLAWFSVVLAVLGIGVATYQATVAASQVSCNLTAAHKFISATGLDELAPEVFKVRASCAEAAASKLLGIPYEVASGLFFFIVLIWLLLAIRQMRLR